MKIQSCDKDIILWGSFIGTTFSEDDQREILKWFMQNKPAMVRDCRKELRELKKSISTEAIAGCANTKNQLA